MSRTRVYLLAAGRGRRAGGPKAWTTHEGRTLLERQVGFLSEVVGPAGVAAAIQREWLERCRALCPEADWVAVDPDQPALASLQAAIRSSPPVGWGFVQHVDMPVWERPLFDAMLERAHASAADAVSPAHQGRKGHPVLLSKPALEALLELDPRVDRLDHWLRGRRVETLEVPYACVLENRNHG